MIRLNPLLLNFAAPPPHKLTHPNAGPSSLLEETSLTEQAPPAEKSSFTVHRIEATHQPAPQKNQAGSSSQLVRPAGQVAALGAVSWCARAPGPWSTGATRTPTGQHTRRRAATTTAMPPPSTQLNSPSCCICMCICL